MSSLCIQNRYDLMSQIQIVDSNPAWDSEFEAIAGDLRAAVGEHANSQVVGLLKALEYIYTEGLLRHQRPLHGYRLPSGQIMG